MRNRLIIGSMALTIVLILLSSFPTPSFAQAAAAPAGGQRAAPPPPKPTPRFADGRVNFGALPGEKGVWVGNGGRLAVNPNSYEPNSTRNAPIHIKDVPLQDWARALTDYRHTNFLADEPHTRCKPSPGPREFITPYGFEIVEIPSIQRAYVFDIGGPHTVREIFMDGRAHPKDLVPDYYGHSVGHWEGDTLVIDTVGFNEKAWMSRDGLPHTDRLHLIERLSRPDFNTLKYDVTIDDLGAYTAPWTSGFTIGWSAGTEIWEYVCQDNNYGPTLMIGTEGESGDRGSRIAP